MLAFNKAVRFQTLSVSDRSTQHTKLFTTVQPHGELQKTCDYLYCIPYAPCTDVRSDEYQAGLDRYLDSYQRSCTSYKGAAPNCTSRPREDPTNCPLFLLKHLIEQVSSVATIPRSPKCLFSVHIRAPQLHQSQGSFQDRCTLVMSGVSVSQVALEATHR